MVAKVPVRPPARRVMSSRHHFPMPRNPLKIASWWYAFGWLFAASLGVLHAWMLHRYVVDFPFEDDIVQVLAAPGYFQFYPTWREKIADLFSLSVEHRIVTMRLAAIVQTWLPGGLDFRSLILFGNLLCAATGLLVIWQAPS